MSLAPVIAFSMVLAAVAIGFSYSGLNIFFFAILTLFFAYTYSRYFGGLEKESVDVVYYVLGSFGVVLFALANPFDLEDGFDREAVRDYRIRVEFMEDMTRFPIRPIAFSNNTEDIIEQLRPYFDEVDFSSLIVRENCALDEIGYCSERNTNYEKAISSANFDEFIRHRPVKLQQFGLSGFFSEYSSVEIFRNKKFSHTFNSDFPAEDVFRLLVTQDEREPSFQKISQIAKSKLSEERASLAFFEGKVLENSNYGVPNIFSQLSGLFWPHILLIALATKLARTTSISSNVLRNFFVGLFAKLNRED